MTRRRATCWTLILGTAAPWPELLVENSGGRRPEFDEEAVSGLRIPWLQRFSDEQLRAYDVEPAPTPQRELLERFCGAPREHGGFHFWDLKRR